MICGHINVESHAPLIVADYPSGEAGKIAAVLMTNQAAVRGDDIAQGATDGRPVANIDCRGDRAFLAETFFAAPAVLPLRRCRDRPLRRARHRCAASKCGGPSDAVATAYDQRNAAA